MYALSTQVLSSVVPADDFSGFAPLQPQVSQDTFPSPLLNITFFRLTGKQDKINRHKLTEHFNKEHDTDTG